jgi:hypothetical protein
MVRGLAGGMIQHTIRGKQEARALSTQCAIPRLFHKRRAPAVSRDNNNRNRKNNRSCNNNGNCSDKRKCSRNDNRSSNRKGKNNRMALVHVSFKSSSQAPPAAAHAQYLARDGQYQQRGGADLVESGNMPEFAQADPHAFWVAADAHERANGRTYTELQIALPRELDTMQRQELAREATRELMGERFAYTLAVHVPLAKDKIDQPHMHLMFSERAIDERTRALPEDQFFKRNGAKKDRETWHGQEKPEQVREQWVQMMNRAMERAGQEQRLDARSWANQGREDLHELREEKTLQGNGPEAMERHAKIDQLRQQRAELPAPHLDQAAAAAQIEREAEKAVSAIERWRDEQLARLEQAIEKIKEVAETARVFVQRGIEAVRERVHGSGSKEVQAQTSPPSQAVAKAVPLQLNPSDELAQQLEQFRAAGRQGRTQRDLKIEAAKPEPVIEPQQSLKKEKEIEIEIKGRGHGHGFSL